MMKSIFYSVLIFITFIQSNAQCGWVGQLNFPAGPINEGSEYLVNVQVYQAGVTPPGGQGANISCYAHFGSVSSFGGAWSNVQTLTMTYDKDTGNNDEYKKDIGPNLTQGLWEYTCYCKCGGSTDSMWVGTNAQLTVNAPLPIKLSDFYGKENSNIIELFWATSSELNNDYFEIQSGNDGANFIPLGIVKGNGTSTKANTYSYAHHSDKAYAYYRLKQVDFDGTVSYSNMIFIKNADYTKSIDIFPNPTLGKLTITGVELESDCSVSVFDLAGKMVKKLVLDQDGQADLSDLHSGLYIIAIIAKNETKNFKLLKG